MIIRKTISAFCKRLRVRRAMRSEYLSLSATVETATRRRDTDAFFAELRKITHQTGEITHTFSEPTGVPIEYIQLHRCGGAVTIHRLWTVCPKRGHGSKMLRQICGLADRYRVFIKLKISPLGPKPYPMSVVELRAWYHRHGFRGDRKLIRSPTSR
jgi:hypothetical protein